MKAVLCAVLFLACHSGLAEAQSAAVEKGVEIRGQIATAEGGLKPLACATSAALETVTDRLFGMLEVVAGPIVSLDVATYGDFRKRSLVGDGIDGHEIWQHANMNAHMLTGSRLSSAASRGNPVIALPRGLHVQIHQADLNLNVRNQTARQNIQRNIDILRRHRVAPDSTLCRLLQMALAHASAYGVLAMWDDGGQTGGVAARLASSSSTDWSGEVASVRVATIGWRTPLSQGGGGGGRVNDVTRQLERIIGDDFESRSAALVAAWSKSGRTVDVVEPILRFMESHPAIDYGSPGELVHFVEEFAGKGYEAMLLQSLERRPTSHTLWMLNRIINATKAQPEKNRLIALMRAVRAHPAADKALQEEVDFYLN